MIDAGRDLALRSIYAPAIVLYDRRSGLDTDRDADVIADSDGEQTAILLVTHGGSWGEVYLPLCQTASRHSQRFSLRNNFLQGGGVQNWFVHRARARSLQLDPACLAYISTL